MEDLIISNYRDYIGRTILDWNITLPSVPKPPVKPLVPPNVNLIIFLFLHKYY